MSIHLACSVGLTRFDILVHEMNPFFIDVNWLTPFCGRHHVQSLYRVRHVWSSTSSRPQIAEGCAGTIYRVRITMQTENRANRFGVELRA
jgi:hypothetical protein